MLPLVRCSTVSEVAARAGAIAAVAAAVALLVRGANGSCSFPSRSHIIEQSPILWIITRINPLLEDPKRLISLPLHLPKPVRQFGKLLSTSHVLTPQQI